MLTLSPFPAAAVLVNLSGCDLTRTLLSRRLLEGFQSILLSETSTPSTCIDELSYTRALDCQRLVRRFEEEGLHLPTIAKDRRQERLVFFSEELYDVEKAG